MGFLRAIAAKDGSDPGQGHDGIANRIHRVLCLLPFRPGALLGGEQHLVDCPAMGDHTTYRGRWKIMLMVAALLI